MSAAEIQEQQALDFGLIAVRANDAESFLRLRHRGLPVSSAGGAGGVLVVAHGRAGRYRLYDLPPNTALEIDVTTVDPLSSGGQGSGERLALDSFSFDALTSDAGGEAVLLLGGTLRTSGSGASYPDGVYQGAVIIEVRYWSVADKAYVSREFGQPVRVEIRTSIVGEQVRPLSFGRVHAVAAASSQAELRLSPAGGVAMRPEAPATITVLGETQPGRIRIGGAAPNQLLQVRFEPEEIALTHRSGSSASAQFRVTNFITSPSGLAFKSDASGALEFSVGATLLTERTDKKYDEGDYEGRVTIEVNY